MRALVLLTGFVFVIAIAQSYAATPVPGGSVSGSWALAGSPYFVSGDLYINEGDSLIIEAGVIVQFEGWHKIAVNGELKALGTAADSIIFTCDTAAIMDRWGGLRFEYGGSGSRLEYCVIEYARASDYWRPTEDTKGGGLYFSGASPTVSNCSIRHNIAPMYYGGGMSATYGASPAFTACDFIDNHAQYGGAVNLEQSADPVFNDCNFFDNSATLNADEFSGGGGGAVHMTFYAEPHFNRCVFARDSAFYWGGAVLTSYTYPKPVFDQCIFYDNAAVYGGAVYAGEDTNFFYNCTFAMNRATDTGGNMYCWSPSVISGCLFAFSNNSGLHIYRTWDEAATIEYCDFYGNAGGDIVFEFGDSTQAAPGLGVRSMLNSNGDSCDVYRNIFFDPLFADAGGRDFHLTEFSKCIDAANPARPLDPDGTTADIGALPFGESALPEAPEDLVARVDEGLLRFFWRPAAGSPPGIVYDLKSSVTLGGPYSLVSTTTDTTLAINISAIPEDRRYFVVVAR